MTWVAGFMLIAGLGVIGLWMLLLIRSRVPEIAVGDRAIWFHLVAEFLMGAALISCGGLLMSSADGEWVRVAAAAALGGLLYSTINSPGYYANRGEWGPVIMFAILATLAFASIIFLILAR